MIAASHDEGGAGSPEESCAASCEEIASTFEHLQTTWESQDWESMEQALGPLVRSCRLAVDPNTVLVVFSLSHKLFVQHATCHVSRPA